MNSDKPGRNQQNGCESGAVKPIEGQPPKPHAKPVTDRRSGRAGPSCPPYNPGLQRLVDGKQAWSEPLDEEAKAQGFLGWHQRGYLPHCDRPGVTQFVTLRLDDAMPASRRSEWEDLLHLENPRERRRRLEECLDRRYWDTLMADEEQFRKAVNYTENNPAKAGLAREPKAWPWSSARFRDEYGRLRFPERSSVIHRLGVMANGLEPRDPRRRLEQLQQQRQELPVSEPQQQQPGQQEQQNRFPGSAGPSSSGALDDAQADPARHPVPGRRCSGANSGGTRPGVSSGAESSRKLRAFDGPRPVEASNTAGILTTLLQDVLDLTRAEAPLNFLRSHSKGG